MPTIEIVKCNPGKGYNVIVAGKYAQHAYRKEQAEGIKWLVEQALSGATDA